MSDARFADGAERPLRLLAQDAEDLRVIAALVQDAILSGADLSWRPQARRLVALVNRFRWEDRARNTGRHPPERVRSLLVIGDVRAVAHQGADPRAGDAVLSLMTLEHSPDSPLEEPGGPAGPGTLTLVLAGGGAIRLTVECLDVQLIDVTRPYAAPSGRAPDHGV